MRKTSGMLSFSHTHTNTTLFGIEMGARNTQRSLQAATVPSEAHRRRDLKIPTEKTQVERVICMCH